MSVTLQLLAALLLFVVVERALTTAAALLLVNVAAGFALSLAAARELRASPRAVFALQSFAALCLHEALVAVPAAAQYWEPARPLQTAPAAARRRRARARPRRRPRGLGLRQPGLCLRPRELP